jgi:hypothetical protein
LTVTLHSATTIFFSGVAQGQSLTLKMRVLAPTLLEKRYISSKQNMRVGIKEVHIDSDLGSTCIMNDESAVFLYFHTMTQMIE